jgi:hypothetical protein
MPMTDEIRDPKLERVRDVWEAPPPSPDLQERISTAYEREFDGARAWRHWFTTRANPVVLASAVLAGVLLLIFATSEMKSRIDGRTNARAPTHVVSPVVSSATPTVQAGGTVQPARRPIARISKHAQSARRTLPPTASSPKETVTAFLPLMDAPPPLGRGILVRTLVPGTMMRAAGVRGWEDRLNESVKADILIGEEGLPRAIRFVVVSQ